MVHAEECEKNEISSPERQREIFKEASYKIQKDCLMDIAKAGMAVLNKMDPVAFKGRKSAEDLGKEGSTTTKVMEELRMIEVVDENNVVNVAQKALALLDLPKSTITLWTKEKLDLKSSFYQIVRRHEKLLNDSFKALKEVDDDVRSGFRELLLNGLMELGWKEMIKQRLPELQQEYSLGINVARSELGEVKTNLSQKFQIKKSGLIDKSLKKGFEIQKLDDSGSEEEKVDTNLSR